MTDFEDKLIEAINDYNGDYDEQAVLDIFFPDLTIGEIIIECYNAGLIPNDILEKFLNDD